MRNLNVKHPACIPFHNQQFIVTTLFSISDFCSLIRQQNVHTLRQKNRFVMTPLQCVEETQAMQRVNRVMFKI